MSLKLSQNTIKIGIIDLEGCFPLIEKGLNNEGSFQISPKLEFRPDKGAPFFKPRFIQLPKPGSKPTSPSKTASSETNNESYKDEIIDEDIVLTIFIIGFNPQFTEFDIYSINTWKKQYPDKPFITLIMNKPQTTWVAITSSRSKIEKKFSKRVPDEKCFVIKYNTNEPVKDNYISLSDFQFLHSSLESQFSLIFENRINELLHTKLNEENYISVYSELASLLLSLGYNSASFTFAAKIRTAPYKIFWPQKPEFYDVQKEVIEKYDTGFDIICSGISQTYAAAKKSSYLYNKLSEELTMAITTILLNSSAGGEKSEVSPPHQIISKMVTEEDKEQEAIFYFDQIPDPHKKFIHTFARNFIHFTSSSFCDVVETINEPVCATFSLIALSQAIFIFKLNSFKSLQKDQEKEDESKFAAVKDGQSYNEEDFLSNLPKERRDVSSCEQLLLSSWGRARKVYTEWPNHQKYFDSIFFNYLTAKDDKEGALRVFNESDSLKIKNDDFFNYFESHVLLQLYEWKKSDKNLAVNIVSSKVPRIVKLEALKLLETVYPIIPIQAKLRCPRFFTPLELFESAPFKIQLKIPDFLISTKNDEENEEFEAPLSIYAIFETANGEKKLKSESVSAVIYEENYILETSVNCIYSGTFSRLTICIQYENTTLCWKVPLNQPLIINEYNRTPNIVVKSPFLLSRNEGEPQATLVSIENLDTECSEIGVTFILDKKDTDKENATNENSGIFKIECKDKTFTDKEMFGEIVFKEVEATMSFYIYINFALFDGITVKCRQNRKGLEPKTISSSFVFPPHRDLATLLVQQNERNQQFQIINRFPVEFEFEVLDENEEEDGNKKVHKMLPNSKYFLLRKKSEEPLVLFIKEKNWEKFPLKIITSSFHAKNEACQLKFDQSRWEVGIPKLVEVTPNAFPIIEDDNEDWIVSSDLYGAMHVFVPRSPGVHQFPQFIVNDQATDCTPEKIEIFPPETPTYVPM